MSAQTDEETVKPRIQEKIRSVINRLLKYIKKWNLVILLIIISPLMYTRKIYEYILIFIFFIFAFLINTKIMEHFSTQFKFDMKKASKRELNAEDNVLLKGIGLFQVIIFIYMGFIEDIIGENIYLQFIKWTIPLFIFSIYIIRGYAHIKNSPKYRTYSSSIIIYYVVIEIYIIIINLISSKLTITIGNVNLIELFFTFVITVFIVSYLRKIHDALKIRYNY